ncbi:hypothetical protein K439DRAFT_1551144, partial [Ramaria rubella]
LVAGDYFKLKLYFIATADMAIQVIKWFNNHSHALRLLRQEQLVTDNQVVALILAVITQWTSYYLSMTRLLEVNKALCLCVIKNGDKLLECGGPKVDAQCKAQEVINTFNDPKFWHNITRLVFIMKTHLKPLAVATHIAQGSNTCLDQILLTLANLYQIYGGMDDLEEDVCVGIQNSLEKHWAKADQDVFILAIFFNPYIHADLFNTNIIQLTHAGVYGIVRWVWCHLFRTEEPQYKLHSACTDYYNGECEFADIAMHLDVPEKQVAAQVGL